MCVFNCTYPVDCQITIALLIEGVSKPKERKGLTITTAAIGLLSKAFAPVSGECHC